MSQINLKAISQVFADIDDSIDDIEELLKEGKYKDQQTTALLLETTDKLTAAQNRIDEVWRQEQQKQKEWNEEQKRRLAKYAKHPKKQNTCPKVYTLTGREIYIDTNKKQFELVDSECGVVLESYSFSYDSLLALAVLLVEDTKEGDLEQWYNDIKQTVERHNCAVKM